MVDETVNQTTDTSPTTSLEHQTTEKPVDTTSNQGGVNKSTIIIVVIVILLLVAVGWYLFKGKNVENNNIASGTSPTTENANDDAVPASDITAADNTVSQIDTSTFSEDSLNDLG